MSSAELKGMLYVKVPTSMSAMGKGFNKDIFNLEGGVILN